MPLLPTVGRLRRRAPGHNVMAVVEEDDEEVRQYVSEEEVSIQEEFVGFEMTPPVSPVENDERAQNTNIGNLTTTTTTPTPHPHLDNLLPEKFVSNLKLRQVLGEGTFSHVYLATHNSKRYAVKKVLLTNLAATVSQAQILSEVHATTQLCHPNIIETLGAYREANAVNIVMRFYPAGTLAGLISAMGKLTDDVARIFTKDIVRGVQYLHGKNIVHRDIKGANVLVDVGCSVRIGDFGSSRSIEAGGASFKTLEGTPSWMAPEVVKQSGHSYAADVWSVGCTVVEMLTGKPPFFECKTPHAVMFAIASEDRPLPIPREATQQAKDFLNMCLVRDQSKRSMPAMLLTTPYLSRPTNFASLQRHRVINFTKSRRSTSTPPADFAALDAFLDGDAPATPKEKRPKRSSSTGIRRLPPATDRGHCKPTAKGNRKRHLQTERCHAARHVVLPLIHHRV